MITERPHQGELSHQLIKKFYKSTNKKNPAWQLAKQERRHVRVRRQRDIYMCSNDHDEGNTKNGVASLPPHLHHRLSDLSSNAFNLVEFLQSSPDDPAFHVSTIISRPMKQARKIFSGLHPKAEGPSSEPTTGPGIRWRRADFFQR